MAANKSMAADQFLCLSHRQWLGKWKRWHWGRLANQKCIQRRQFQSRTKDVDVQSVCEHCHHCNSNWNVWTDEDAKVNCRLILWHIHCWQMTEEAPWKTKKGNTKEAGYGRDECYWSCQNEMGQWWPTGSDQCHSANEQLSIGWLKDEPSQAELIMRFTTHWNDIEIFTLGTFNGTLKRKWGNLMI